MTPQEVFNKVVTHLRVQGCKAERKFGEDKEAVCAYRVQTEGTPLRCAVGCLIPDEEYRTDMEGKGLDALLESGLLTRERQDEFFRHRRLLQALQQIHDYNSIEEWEEEFQMQADERGLQLPENLLTGK